MKPKILVVGCGAWGKNIVRVCDELGVLWGICDTKSLSEIEIPAKIMADALWYEDLKEALNSKHKGGCNAVIIASPVKDHFNHARIALDYGVHVLVEKPMAASYEEGCELTKLADGTGQVLMVGHLMQYHPAFEELRTLVHSEKLGKLRYINAVRANDGKVRSEESVLWSFAPHDISMIVELVGGMPIQVGASGGCYINKKVHDVTSTHLKFRDNIQADMYVNWLSPIKEQKLIVIGEEGRAVFDDTQPREQKLKINSKFISYPNMNSEPLEREITHFLNCIMLGKKPLTSGRRGVDVLDVLDAASKSLEKSDLEFEDNKSKVFTCSNESMEPLSYKLEPPERSEQEIEEKLKKVLDVIDNLTKPGKFNIGSTPDVEAAENPYKSGYEDMNTFSKEEIIFNTPALLPKYKLDSSSSVHVSSEIGEGTKIWANSKVFENCKIGKNCTIGSNVHIGPNVTIGDGVKIQNNVSVYDGVTIEDAVFIGPSVVFTNVKRPRAFLKGTFEKTLIETRASIGANATIICGATVGVAATVGAGAVVTKDVPWYTTVYGNPARIRTPAPDEKSS